MKRLVSEPDNNTVLYLGAENRAFPVPLISKNGVWRFDAKTGRNEVLCRRIGENEDMVIGTFPLLVLAEQQHKQLSEGPVPEFTTRFVDVSEARSGLAQKAGHHIPDGLAKAGIDDQMAAGSSAVPYYGYDFLNVK